MSYSPNQVQARRKKPNRDAKLERKKKKGRMAGISGAGNRTLARIINERSERIKKKNPGIST